MNNSRFDITYCIDSRCPSRNTCLRNPERQKFSHNEKCWVGMADFNRNENQDKCEAYESIHGQEY